MSYTVRCGATPITLEREPTIGVLWKLWPALQEAQAGNPLGMQRFAELASAELKVPLEQLAALTLSEFAELVEDFSAWVSSGGTTTPAATAAPTT